MAAEQFVNDLDSGTTLYTALTDTTGTTVVVVNYAGIPSVPQFRIKIDTEIFLVTAISIGGSNSTLTVTRGAEGSTAATHLAGAGVYHIPTAASIIQAGRQYSAFPTSPGFTVPVDSGFTTFVNSGSATHTQTNYGITITDPIAAGDHWRQLLFTCPSTPYTLTTLIQANVPSENSHYFGLIWSDGTKLVTASLISSTSLYGAYKASVDKWTNSTTASANYTYAYVSFPDWWQQITDDGTNRIYRISRDGLNWQQIHSVSRTDFLTPTVCGVAWNASGSTAHPFSGSIISFKQT
jgi:hypothetical protein